MIKKILAVVAVAVATLAAVAWAQEARLDLYRFNPQWFTRGIYVGPEESPNVSATTANKITRTLGGSISFNFGSKSITCEDSTAITVTGAQVSDPCFVGPPDTLDAGGGGNSSFTCYVSAADAVKVRHCASGTADDPNTATFNVRVISAQ